jgi:hypothetical protein
LEDVYNKPNPGFLFTSSPFPCPLPVPALGTGTGAGTGRGQGKGALFGMPFAYHIMKSLFMEGNMNNKKATQEDLIKKLAKLEFINDQLVTELAFLDQLMRKVGFTEGLESLKITALEIYEKEDKSPNDQAA